MRVLIVTRTVVAPTRGNTNETQRQRHAATAVLSVVGRACRARSASPASRRPTPPPGGRHAPPIPRWDFNPELITVDSDALGRRALDCAAGARRRPTVAGPLDYSFRRYTVAARPGCGASLPPGTGAAPARACPTRPTLTVAGYNLERFFDTVDDPAISEPVLHRRLRSSAAWPRPRWASASSCTRRTSSAWSRSRTSRCCRRSPSA